MAGWGVIVFRTQWRAVVMARRKVGFGLGVVVLGAMIASGLAWSLAQDSATGAAPVNLLPGNSVLCVTFDGGAAHEEAF